MEEKLHNQTHMTAKV